MNKQQKMALMSLIGLILPFGSVWGPVIIAPDDTAQQRFRRKLITSQALLIVAAWIVGAVLMSRSMVALTGEIDAVGLRTGIALSSGLFWVGTTVISLIFYLRASSTRQLPCPPPLS